MKRILVSQPKPAAGKSPYNILSTRFGMEVVFRPFIKVVGMPAREFRQQKIYIPEYTGIIFTARTAVDHYFALCEETRFHVPDTMKYFCLNESIANYLQKYIIYRKRKIFFSETGRIEDLIPYLVKHSKEKFLLPISDTHRREKTIALDKQGIVYQPAVMYRTVSNDFAPDEPFDYDMLLFFSPSGVKSLQSNFPDFKQGDIAIGAMGDSTIEAVNNAGLRLDITISPEAPSMAAAAVRFLRENYPELEIDGNDKE